MEQGEIDYILSQIGRGINEKRFIYKCCKEAFPSLYDFRKHLYENHQEDYRLFFEPVLHRKPIEKLSKEELHRRISRNKRKPRQKKKSYSKGRSALSAQKKGGHFHLIYTPMGNKR